MRVFVHARLCAALSLCLAGCTLGPDFQRPPAPQVEGYRSASEWGGHGGGTQAAAGAQDTAAWWRRFGCAKLDAVVDEALAHSPTLETARATLSQSENSLKAGEGVFYPEVDASFGLARQRPSPFRLGPATPASGLFNLYTLGATISYSLDPFGVQRRAVERLGAQADAQRYAAAAAYLTLSASVVDAVIAYAGYSEQWRVAQHNADLARDQLALLRVQAASGLVSETAVQQQAMQYAQVRATLAPLARQQSQSLHLLSRLLGRASSQPLPPLPRLDELHAPAMPPLTLPSELVHQRPDILQAEAELHEANAALGVATAQMWPSVSLAADAGFGHPTLNGLTDWSNRFWSVGPTATTTLSQGGSQTFQQRAAADAVQGAQARYREVVLVAFSQVADALAGLQYDAGAWAASTDATAAARRQWQLAGVNANAGLFNRQQVQAAEIAYGDEQNLQVQAQVLRLQDSVALYAALGGSWWADGPAWLHGTPDPHHAPPSGQASKDAR